MVSPVILLVACGGLAVAQSIGHANSLLSTPRSGLCALTPPAHRVLARFPRDCCNRRCNKPTAMLNREVFVHSDGVQRLVRNAEIAAGPESRVIDSWRRSLANHGLDPSRSNEPRILTSHELREFQTPLEQFLALSRPALDRL